MNPLSEGQLKREQDEEKQELLRQCNEKDRNFENYKKSIGQLQVYIKQVTDSISPITPLPLAYEPKKRRSRKSVSACMQTADSHMGAVQMADEIEGLNEYSPEICRERNLLFVQKSLNYVETLRQGYDINTLHYFFTGDLISGDIHQELMTTNAFPSPVQVVEAAKIHSQQVGMLASHFAEVHVHFISADNHARLTKKPQAAEAGINSLNYLVGVMMQQYLANHTNVNFGLYPVTEKVIRVEEFNYLTMHGHTIKQWMGVPYYGIERKAGRESTVRLAAIMKEQNEAIVRRAKEIGFNKMMHSHFHTKFNGELMRCAASVQGTTSYDHNNGRFSPASQPFWLVSGKWEFANTDFQLT